MHRSLCVCPLVTRIATRTRLVLVIHRVEDRKPSNTGRLAALALAGSEVLVRGDAAHPSEPIAVPPGSTAREALERIARAPTPCAR